MGDMGDDGRAGEVEEVVKDPDGDYEVDLVESFFSELDLR